MKNIYTQNIRVLGIAPSSRGFGFALMEGNNALVHWGIKSVKGGDKNARSLANAAGLIAQWHPDVIAISDTKGSRRGSGVQVLTKEIIALAQSEEIKVERFSRRQVSLGVLKNCDGTKQELAEHFAIRFPDELGFRLPRKRRLWTSEGYQMDMFEAVALAHHFTQRDGTA